MPAAVPNDPMTISSHRRFRPARYSWSTGCPGAGRRSVRTYLARDTHLDKEVAIKGTCRARSPPVQPTDSSAGHATAGTRLPLGPPLQPGSAHARTVQPSEHRAGNRYFEPRHRLHGDGLRARAVAESVRPGARVPVRGSAQRDDRTAARRSRASPCGRLSAPGHQARQHLPAR